MARFAQFAPLVLLALAVLARPAVAAESLDSCDVMVDVLPAVLTQPGTYCLNKHVGLILEAGNAITIGADDVVLDCHGHTIDNDTASAATTANGIAGTDRRNAVVRDCRVDGFFRGIALQGALGGGHVVEGNRAVNSRSIGIEVAGDGSVVRDNVVANTGGSSIDPDAAGIRTANGVDVLDNTIDSVLGGVGGNVFGIASLDSPGGSIAGNRVRGLAHGVGTLAAGIHALNHGRLALRRNDLVGAPGDANSFGLFCATNTAKARDNVISGWGTAIGGCGNASGNVVRP